MSTVDELNKLLEDLDTLEDMCRQSFSQVDVDDSGYID